MLHLPRKSAKMILEPGVGGTGLFLTWILFGFFDNTSFGDSGECFPIVFMLLLSSNCLINCPYSQEKERAATAGRFQLRVPPD